VKELEILESSESDVLAPIPQPWLLMYLSIYHAHLKLHNQILKVESTLHEYAELTSTPKAELLCSCKCRKSIYISKFVNYKVKMLSFLVKKLVDLVITGFVG